jgi:phosphoribosylglycinamide formyltransferase-1
MLKIGVLASGRGSNFQSIVDAVDAGFLKAEIACLISDNPNSFALERARQNGIEALHVAPKSFPSKDDFYASVAHELKSRDVGLVALAGFMRIVGRPLIAAYRDRIMNIHPALLPSFKGLHAQRQAVEYGARVSGCTVHFVDEGMDTGPIIIQAAVPVSPADTEDSLSERILRMEHRIYPLAIKLYAEGRLRVEGRRVIIIDEAGGVDGMREAGGVYQLDDIIISPRG